MCVVLVLRKCDDAVSGVLSVTLTRHSLDFVFLFFLRFVLLVYVSR